MSKSNKNILVAVLVLAAILVVYFGLQYFAEKSFVPQSFTDGRQQSAAISGDIVGLLNESLKNLETISQEDKNYHFSKALDLVYVELARTQESKKKASDLTAILEQMAKVLPAITPTQAKNLAIEAVSNEVSLVSHLLIYNDSLSGLLETLKYKFSGDIRYDSKDVQALVNNMNQEAEAINNLNDVFNQKMREFDSLTR